MIRKIEKPIAVLAITGPHRTGKSYILSRMLGKGDAFAFGNTFDPKTLGVWIGTSVVDCGDHVILLLDTEGIKSFDAEGDDDVKILVFSLLASSYFIYNSKHLVSRHDLLNMK